MSALDSSGFEEFDRLAEVFRRTLTLLDAVLATGDVPEDASEVIATQTLPWIEDMEEGFRARLRTSETDLTELRALVLLGGLGLPEPRDTPEARAALIEAMQARAGAGGQRRIAPTPGRPLTAVEHARLVFALIPVTPEADVRYPAGRRSYSDISAPRTPVELAGRIEELERRLWSVATGRRPDPVDPASRRVYGFFDIGERLARAGLRSDGSALD